MVEARDFARVRRHASPRSSRAAARFDHLPESSHSLERVRSARDCHHRSALHRHPSLARGSVYPAHRAHRLSSCDRPIRHLASDSLGSATCMQRLRQWLLRHRVSIDERLALVKGDNGSAAVNALGDILPGTTRACSQLFQDPPPLPRGPSLLPADLCLCWGGKSQRSRNLLVSRIARPPSPYPPTGSMTSRQLSA